MIFTTPAIQARHRKVSFLGADSRPGIGRGPAGWGFFFRWLQVLSMPAVSFFCPARSLRTLPNFS